MKRLALMVAVLFFASAAQAYVGYSDTYDFDSLTPNYDPNSVPLLNGASEAAGTWKVSEAGNIDRLIVGDDGAGDQWAEVRVSFSSERLCFDPNGTDLWSGNLDSTDTYITLVYTGYMDATNTHWLAGIWTDLDANGTMPNSEAEIAVQFGCWPRTDDRTDRYYRVRGGGGSPSTTSGNIGHDPNVFGAGNYELTLDIRLDQSQGYASLKVSNLDNSCSEWVIVGAPLGSDPNYMDPNTWTSWTVRNQSSGIAATIDNLTVHVIPEPATLSLLVLGGLACLRRRRW